MKFLSLPFAALLLFVVSLVNAGDRPQRIVSISLCTDQLLLLLAERDQIASLSTWAVDENMSYMIDAVGDIPLKDSSIEEIIRYQPDLVVANRFAAWDSTKFLRQLGNQVKQIPLAESIAEIYDLLREYGEWTGNQRRAVLFVALVNHNLNGRYRQSSLSKTIDQRLESTEADT